MATKSKVGRKPLFKGKAGYLTVLLPQKTLAKIGRLAGAAPGQQAATVRRIIDAGLAATAR